MPNSQRFRYKCYAITTRWTELVPPAGQPHRCPNASYMVDPISRAELSWQQFSKAVFESHRSAALTQARRTINLSLEIA